MLGGPLYCVCRDRACSSGGHRHRDQYAHRGSSRSSWSCHPRSENGAIRPVERWRSFRRRAQRIAARPLRRCRESPLRRERKPARPRVGLPMACPGGLAKKQDPVAVTSQLRGAAFALRARRLRCLPAEHRELRGFGVEIDDAQHIVLRFRSGLSRIVAPQFDCGDRHFWRPLQRFRGAQFDGTNDRLKSTHGA